jgi:tetratricopeptide (TPR) repeat protein
MRCAEESLEADLALAGNQDFRASSSDLWILGTTAQVAGRCVDAQARLQQCLDSLKNSAEETSASWGGALPTVAVLLWLDRTLLYRGLLAQGRQMNEEALAISRRSGHPPSVTWALLGMINWLNLQSRYQEAEDLAREGMELSQRFHIKPRIAGFRIIQGRGMVAAGKVREGAALMRSGVDLWLEHSSVMTATLMITTPASAMAAVGDVRAVQEYLEMGEQLMRDTEERIGQAELLRLRAWVCRHTGDLIGAQKALEDALTVAERQGARYFALRAAIDLVKQSDGDQHEAAALADLKRVYTGFTEGFGFPVLVGARRLLESRGVLIPLQPS